MQSVSFSSDGGALLFGDFKELNLSPLPALFRVQGLGNDSPTSVPIPGLTRLEQLARIKRWRSGWMALSHPLLDPEENHPKGLLLRSDGKVHPLEEATLDFEPWTDDFVLTVARVETQPNCPRNSKCGAQVSHELHLLNAEGKRIPGFAIPGVSAFLPLLPQRVLIAQGAVLSAVNRTGADDPSFHRRKFDRAPVTHLLRARGGAWAVVTERIMSPSRVWPSQGAPSPIPDRITIFRLDENGRDDPSFGEPVQLSLKVRFAESLQDGSLLLGGWKGMNLHSIFRIGGAQKLREFPIQGVPLSATEFKPGQVAILTFSDLNVRKQTLVRFDPNRGVISQSTLVGRGFAVNGSAKSVFSDSEGNLYLPWTVDKSTRFPRSSPVVLLNPAGKQDLRFSLANPSIPEQELRQVYRASNGTLWAVSRYAGHEELKTLSLSDKNGQSVSFGKGPWDSISIIGESATLQLVLLTVQGNEHRVRLISPSGEVVREIGLGPPPYAEMKGRTLRLSSDRENLVFASPEKSGAISLERYDLATGEKTPGFSEGLSKSYPRFNQIFSMGSGQWIATGQFQIRTKWDRIKIAIGAIPTALRYFTNSQAGREAEFGVSSKDRSILVDIFDGKANGRFIPPLTAWAVLDEWGKIDSSASRHLDRALSRMGISGVQVVAIDGGGLLVQGRSSLAHLRGGSGHIPRELKLPGFAVQHVNAGAIDPGGRLWVTGEFVSDKSRTFRLLRFSPEGELQAALFSSLDVAEF